MWSITAEYRDHSFAIPIFILIKKRRGVEGAQIELISFVCTGKGIPLFGKRKEK